MAKKNRTEAGTDIRTDQEKAAPFLKEGTELLAGQRYEDAIDLLREGVRIDRRNPLFFIRLGTAALYLDYLDEAERYFQKALQLVRDDEQAMNGLSYIYLKTDRSADAAEMLCDLLKLYPKNKIARKNFNRIKESDSVENLQILIHPSEFIPLPRIERFRQSEGSRKRFHILSYSVISLSAFVLFFKLGPSICSRPPIRIPWGKGDRKVNYRYPGDAALNTDIGRRLNRAVNANYNTGGNILGDGEGSAMVTRIKHLLDNREYNETQFVYNKLMVSSPDIMTMSSASNLIRFYRDPDPDSLKFNPTADSITEKPWLYSRVYVKWFSRTVMHTNGVFLQVAPARYHNGKKDNIDVVVVGRNIPRLYKGSKVEVFGSVLGVDRQGKGNRDLVFILLKRLKQLK